MLNHLLAMLGGFVFLVWGADRFVVGAAASFRPFNIEKPLWIFVGGSVTATLATRDASDIVEILQFLSRYVEDRTGSIQRIERVANG